MFQNPVIRICLCETHSVLFMAVYSFILTIMKNFALKLQIILLVKPEASFAGKALFTGCVLRRLKHFNTYSDASPLPS